MNTLGDRIKSIRKKNNLNQKEFAERTCVSSSYISKVEANKETPTEMLLKLISLEFNISYWWLKDGKEDKEIKADKLDYFERNNLEGYHSSLISDLTRIVEKLKTTAPSEMDMLMSALLTHLQIISNEIQSDEKIKTVIFDSLVSTVVSYAELISNLAKIDISDKSYENKIFYNVRLITVDVEERLIELGNHYCERKK